MEKRKLSPCQMSKQKNEEGHIGLLFLMLLSFLALFFLYFSFSIVKTHETVANQMEATLCFQKTVSVTKDLLDKIIISNDVIYYAFIAKNIPGPHVKAATLTHKLTKVFQQAYYAVSILKLLDKKKQCSFKNIYSYTKSLPLKRKGLVLLQRDTQGRTIIEKEQWQLKQSVDSSGYISERITFLGDFTLNEGKVSVKTQWREASLKWKRLFGLD